MFLWKVIQHVDQSHSVPSDGPAPKVRRLSSPWIGPTLLPGFVPAVIEQASISIARMQVHQRKLLRDIVEICILMQSLRILRVERLGHVQAVKPHLRGIDLLVPEAAVGSTWLGLQLCAQKRGRLEVLFFFRDLIEQQQNSAVEYVVEVVVVKPVRLNRAIIAYKLVDSALDVLELIPVTCFASNAIHTLR